MTEANLQHLAQLREQHRVIDTQTAACELAIQLGLSEQSSAEFIAAIGAKVTRPQIEIDTTNEHILGIARGFGWRVNGGPVPRPTDSHVTGTVVFDSEFDDSEFLQNASKVQRAQLANINTALDEARLRDVGTGQVIRFMGRVFDAASGIDTPVLVARPESLTNPEVDHLDKGSVLKAVTSGMLTQIKIAELSGYSRPSVTAIGGLSTTTLVTGKLQPEYILDAFDEVVSNNQPVRVLIRNKYSV